MKYVALFIVALAVLACDISRYVNGRSDSANANVARSSPTPEVRHPVETPRPEVSPQSTIGLQTKKWVGKYPYEAKILENPELRSRLQKLMGKDLADLRSHFNVETPIEMENGIFRASACEAHNCGANNYYIYIDVAADNINVYHIDESGTKTYFESGKIKLPSKFAADMNNE